MVTLCCCLPTGIYAIVKANASKQAASMGDMVTAAAEAGKARKFTFISIAAGLVIVILAALLNVLTLFTLSSSQEQVGQLGEEYQDEYLESMEDAAGGTDDRYSSPGGSDLAFEVAYGLYDNAATALLAAAAPLDRRELSAGFISLEATLEPGGYMEYFGLEEEVIRRLPPLEGPVARLAGQLTFLGVAGPGVPAGQIADDLGHALTVLGYTEQLDPQVGSPSGRSDGWMRGGAYVNGQGDVVSFSYLSADSGVTGVNLVMSSRPLDPAALGPDGVTGVNSELRNTLSLITPAFQDAFSSSGYCPDLSDVPLWRDIEAEECAALR